MSTFRTPRRSARLAVATAITVAAALTGPVSQAASTGSGAPSPGAAGLGDPIFPLDGNGGYEVSRYTLDFDWQAPKTPFEASTTIKATATQALSRFNLDFAGNTLHTVTVNGRSAAAVREGDELVITPANALARGKAFTVKVTYTADPTQIRHRDDAIEDYGWIPTPDGTVLYPQPNGAKMIFPSNDHPSRRAPITFHITTPAGLSAVANGKLTDRTEQADGRVRWTYDSEQPVATQLVAAGDREVHVRRQHRPARAADPRCGPGRPGGADRAVPQAHRRPSSPGWRSGSAPTPSTGTASLSATPTWPVALETQTLSLDPEGRPARRPGRAPSGTWCTSSPTSGPATASA